MSGQKYLSEGVNTKPLSRTQLFLVELKHTIVLLREVLEELKGLLVIAILLALLLWEAWKLFH
jgi:hypothetical protein